MEIDNLLSHRYFTDTKPQYENNHSYLQPCSEDIDFNNTYALGKNQNFYYIQNPNNNKLETRPISEDYLQSVNLVTIDIDTTKITNESIGSYKIIQEEANITIQEGSINNISDQYAISTIESQ
jgi:hypothetical protein